ncbi:hypothetical protein L6452_43270 [Arctium lappa]|uniref:Uncharacterized protein n=1 Tax=Arctium lappa TaxID=4217 RepID=A0ACB8XLD2_ARCLA|nr:hypothetical protein L6452_43270 [Arctium lappa]
MCGNLLLSKSSFCFSFQFQIIQDEMRALNGPQNSRMSFNDHKTTVATYGRYYYEQELIAIHIRMHLPAF